MKPPVAGSPGESQDQLIPVVLSIAADRDLDRGSTRLIALEPPLTLTYTRP